MYEANTTYNVTSLRADVLRNDIAKESHALKPVGRVVPNGPELPFTSTEWEDMLLSENPYAGHTTVIVDSYANHPCFVLVSGDRTARSSMRTIRAYHGVLREIEQEDLSRHNAGEEAW